MKKSIRTTSEQKPTSLADLHKNTYGVTDWRTMRGPRPNSAAEEHDSEFSEFFQVYWPATISYESALNPIFLLDLQKAAKATPERKWLIRDGLVPLLWFFSHNPEPAGFRGRLSIHADFESYVPNAWREQVDLYELFSDGNTAHVTDEKFGDSPYDELVLSGIVTPSVCSIAQLKTDLDGIIEAAGGIDRLSKMRIRAFLPPKFETTDYLSGPSYNNIFLQTLFRKVGLSVEFLEYEGFQWMPPSQSAWFHEFNQKLLYADSMLTMLSLSKGHRPVLQKDKSLTSAYDQVFPVFPYVSCGIRKKFREEFVDYTSENWMPDSQTRAKSFYYATSSPANSAYPWPKWFVGWCKEIQRTTANCTSPTAPSPSMAALSKN